MTDKITNWTRADDAMVEAAIRRGASPPRTPQDAAWPAASRCRGRHRCSAAPLSAARRDAGDRRASQGRGLVVLDRRHARSGQGLALHRLCPLLRLYNRLTFLDENGDSADGAGREHRQQRRQDLDRQAASPGVTFHDGKTSPPMTWSSRSSAISTRRSAPRSNRSPSRWPTSRRSTTRPSKSRSPSRTPTCRPSWRCTTS